MRASRSAALARALATMRGSGSQPVTCAAPASTMKGQGAVAAADIEDRAAPQRSHEPEDQPVFQCLGDLAEGGGTPVGLDIGSELTGSR